MKESNQHKEEEGTINAPLIKDETKGIVRVSKEGKEAITKYRVVEKYNDCSLLECELLTGRTHQIRVHMKYIGYPIYNDPIYTNAKCSDFGQFLHSREIDFNHPITNKHLHFTAPLPKEFQDFINNLTSLES